MKDSHFNDITNNILDEYNNIDKPKKSHYNNDFLLECEICNSTKNLESHHIIPQKDFDNNDSYDAFPALYLPTSHTDTIKKLYPAQTREDIVKQMISMRAKYQNFKSFAVSPIDQMFTAEQLNGAQILKANYFGSSFLRNNGNGKFELVPLPKQAQFSVLNGILVDDYDMDGNLDVLLNGNDYGTEVLVGVS